MIPDDLVYSMIVEHDSVVPMIEQIDQIMEALLDHDLIVSITIKSTRAIVEASAPDSLKFSRMGMCSVDKEECLGMQ